MLDLWCLNIETLDTLYKKQVEQLNKLLLSGASWEETKQQRQTIAEIATILYKRRNADSFDNPAENPARNHG